MRGRKCDNCGHYTLFLVNGLWLCSECGISICTEWGEICPYGLHKKVQEICLACWGHRLDTRKNSIVKGGSERRNLKNIVGKATPRTDVAPTGRELKMSELVEKGFHSDGNRRGPPLEVVDKKNVEV